MAQQNITQLQSNINTKVNDNTTGEISAADVRDNLIDITDSLLFNSGSQTFDGTLTATAFLGDGSGLTGISTNPFPYNGNPTINGALTVNNSIFTDNIFTQNLKAGGNVEITGSLLTSGSVVDFTNSPSISGSTFSGSFVGDGSALTGVTGEWDGSLNGNAEITGSLTVTGDIIPNRIAKNGTLEVAGSFLALNSLTTTQISGPSGISIIGDPSIDGDVAIGGNTLMTGSLTASGSVVDFTDATAISGSTFSGSFVGDGSGLTLPSTSGTAKMFSGVFAENSGVSLALSTERNDFDSTSPLIASRIGVGSYVFTFSVGAFDLNSSSTVYSFQPDPNSGTVSVGFYSADTQGSNQLYIFARDTTGAMADGVLDDVEFRITQFSS